MPADGSGTDLKHGGSSLPDLTNFKIEPNPSANNFVHMSGGTCSTIKVEEPDQGSPYSSVRKSYNYYLLPFFVFLFLHLLVLPNEFPGLF